MTLADELPPVLTASEARTLVRCGERQLYDALDRGEIQGVKVAGRWKIPRDPLLRRLGLLDDDVQESGDENVVELRHARGQS